MRSSSASWSSRSSGSLHWKAISAVGMGAVTSVSDASGRLLKFPVLYPVASTSRRTSWRGRLNLMPDVDLSKLRIDRGTDAGAPRGRWRRRAAWLALVLIVATGIGVAWRVTVPIPVETATITTAYPSQAYTILNAT